MLDAGPRDIIFTGDACKNRAELVSRDTDMTYDSAVSQHLITRFTRQQVLWFSVIAVVGLLLLAGWCALLAARVREKLEDDFPETQEALLAYRDDRFASTQISAQIR